eukprot:jgi/Chlat1/5458/Chrsp36S09004
MNRPPTGAGAAVGSGGGAAGPAAALQQRQAALLQRLDANVAQLNDNFSNLVAASKVNDVVRNAQERFQMDVHAAKIVQAARDLMNLIAELKVSAIVGDFERMNSKVEVRKAQFQQQMADAEKTLANLSTDLQHQLRSLETHFYWSPYRTGRKDSISVTVKQEI